MIKWIGTGPRGDRFKGLFLDDLFREDGFSIYSLESSSLKDLSNFEFNSGPKIIIVHDLESIQFLLENNFNLDRSLIFVPWERELSEMSRLRPGLKYTFCPYPLLKTPLNQSIVLNSDNLLQNIKVIYEGPFESRLHILSQSLSSFEIKNIEILYDAELEITLYEHIESLPLDSIFRNSSFKSLETVKKDNLFSSVFIYPHYSAIKPMNPIILDIFQTKSPIIIGSIDRLLQFPNVIRSYVFGTEENISLKAELDRLSNDIKMGPLLLESMLHDYAIEYCSQGVVKAEIVSAISLLSATR